MDNIRTLADVAMIINLFIPYRNLIENDHAFNNFENCFL